MIANALPVKTAREKFRKGDRVEMTRYGRRHLRFCMGSPPSTTGEVIGFSRAQFSVLVRRTGHKTPTSYFVGFWKRTYK